MVAHRPGKYLVCLADPADWNGTIGEDCQAAAFVDRTSEQTAFAVLDAAAPPDERLLARVRHHVGPGARGVRAADQELAASLGQRLRQKSLPEVPMLRIGRRAGRKPDNVPTRRRGGDEQVVATHER